MTRTSPIWCEATEAWTDIVKAGDGSERKRMLIGGIASTEGLDLQHERVVQDGLNFEPFLDRGWFNDDHKAGTVLGWPTDAKLVRKGEKLPSGRRAAADGWWVSGELVDTPRGRDIYQTAVALERQKAPRRLGFSIEGQILTRAGGTIVRADVNEVAITKKPVNTETHLETLAKALEAGHSDPTNDEDPETGAPLRRQDLEGAPKVADYSALKSKTDWMDAIGKSGMSKGAFLDKLKKESGEEYERACKAMEINIGDDDEDEDEDEGEGEGEEEKSLKSLSELADLRKSLDAMEKKMSKSRFDAADPGAYFDDDDIREARSIDVTGLVKALTNANVQGFQAVSGNQETLQEIVGLQGRLLKSMAEAQIKSTERFAAELNTIQKSLEALGASPAVRRGATNPADAKAMARFAKSGNANGFEMFKPADAPRIADALVKSAIAAVDAGNHQKAAVLQSELGQFERRAARGQVALPSHVAEMIDIRSA